MSTIYTKASSDEYIPGISSTSIIHPGNVIVQSDEESANRIDVIQSTAMVVDSKPYHTGDSVIRERLQPGALDNARRTKKLTFMLKLFVFLLSLDAFCFPKFIIFPHLLISIVGGPLYIIVPWSLWALLAFIYQTFVTFAYSKPLQVIDATTATDNSPEPSTWRALIMLKTNIYLLFDFLYNRFRNGPIPFQLVEEDGQVEFQLSRGIEVGYMLFSFIDILLTAITIFATFGIIIEFFREPDKEISSGWRIE